MAEVDARPLRGGDEVRVAHLVAKRHADDWKVDRRVKADRDRDLQAPALLELLHALALVLEPPLDDLGRPWSPKR